MAWITAVLVLVVGETAQAQLSRCAGLDQVYIACTSQGGSSISSVDVSKMYQNYFGGQIERDSQSADVSLRSRSYRRQEPPPLILEEPNVPLGRMPRNSYDIFAPTRSLGAVQSGSPNWGSR
jgi:hypothetical protein